MRFWNDIEDLPVYFYQKVVSTGKLEYLVFDNSEETDPKELNEAWIEITEQLSDRALKSSEYFSSLQAEKRHFLSKIKAALTERAIDIINYEIKKDQFEKDKEPFDYNKSIAILENKIGQIDDKKMSVARYLTHLDILKQNAKHGK